MLDCCLYAVGGFNGTNGLDTVKKYNLGKSVETLRTQKSYTIIYMYAYLVSYLTRALLLARNGLVIKVEFLESVPKK